MANILDGICPEGCILDGFDDWPRSATREEWFALTRDLVASTIAEMGEYLDDAELSVVEEYFDATNFYDHQTPDPTAHR